MQSSGRQSISRGNKAIPVGVTFVKPSLLKTRRGLGLDLNTMRRRHRREQLRVRQITEVQSKRNHSADFAFCFIGASCFGEGITARTVGQGAVYDCSEARMLHREALSTYDL